MDSGRACAWPRSSRSPDRQAPPPTVRGVTGSSPSGRLDLDGLVAAVRTLARVEPRFARIVARHGPPLLWPREPGFEALVLLMLEQQVSLAQARAMYARVASASGSVTPVAIAEGHALADSLGGSRSYAPGYALPSV